MLREYFEIQKQIKRLEEQAKTIREVLIAKGTHSEKNYICEVTEQNRRSLSLVEIEKRDHGLFLQLDQDGFIKSSVTHVVKVLKKAS